MKLLTHFLVILFALFSSLALSAPLINSYEAALPPAAEVFNARGISRGPGIKLNSPESTMSVTSPFDLKVSFEARGEGKIDPSSVQVLYLKNPYVDLTPRLKGGISRSGIDFSKAEVPAGTHSIRVSVKDTDGHETKSVFTLVVNK